MDALNTSSNAISIHPSFGSSAKFSCVLNSVGLGDNRKQRSLKGINGLKMSLSLNFNEITDKQSNDLIYFFQKQFDYEPQIYNSNGSFDNKRIEPFNYTPFYPYKQNQFSCLNYNHNKIYYNANNVQATLTAIAPSILSSVESGPGHNSNIDAIVNVNLNSSSSVSDNNVDLSQGSPIFESGNYATAYLDNAFNVNANSSAVLSASSNFNFSNGNISVNQTPARHSIYIDSPNDCFYYPYAPIHNNSSLNVRMFDFRPTTSSSISHSPKYLASRVSDVYQKNNKYGLNARLNNLSLTFEGRSDLEAKRILLFLESHLGYKKFGFHFQKEYDEQLSYFYCPEWTHTFTYKDNHSIQAQFIECVNY